jgi:hypothetical protein
MINQNLLDELLKDCQKPEDILSENGLLRLCAAVCVNGLWLINGHPSIKQNREAIHR